MAEKTAGNGLLNGNFEIITIRKYYYGSSYMYHLRLCTIVRLSLNFLSSVNDKFALYSSEKRQNKNLDCVVTVKSQTKPKLKERRFD